MYFPHVIISKRAQTGSLRAPIYLWPKNILAGSKWYRNLTIVHNHNIDNDFVNVDVLIDLDHFAHVLLLHKIATWS